MTEREGHRFLDHVTDAFVEAWAPTLEGAFAQSAIALFETMLHIEKVHPTLRENIIAQGHDELELLYNWLEALLLKFETENKAYVKFEVNRIQRLDEGFLLRAYVSGETYDEARHGRRVGVKGVTYHQMTVEREDEIVTIRFILDL